MLTYFFLLKSFVLLLKHVKQIWGILKLQDLLLHHQSCHPSVKNAKLFIKHLSLPVHFAALKNTRLVSKSLVDVLLVENWLHGRVNGVIKEHTGGQMERCKHRGKAGWRIRLKDCVDRWTVIHYGQMETEAVWKTEFLFNCDALEFVSIQNEKRVNTLAFFNKMEMFLNP